jgi:NAD(P) transhydrogenase subunit beta
MNPNLINFIYLIAGVLFIVGIKGLTKPKTAVRGNMLSALGMLLAVAVTLLTINDVDYRFIVAGVAVGSIVGGVMALRIQMTSMPQMVALLNGFGGGASLTIALAEYFSTIGAAPTSMADMLVPVIADSSAFGVGPEGTIALIAIGLTVMIGAVTLSGSFVAFAKLQELMKNSYGLPGGPIGNALLFLAALASF